jgi:branched-chain amino acid aminotransferase
MVAAPLGTGSGKLGGNYAPVFRHSAEAKHKGFPITLHLDSKTRTYIDEFSTSNFVALAKDPCTQATTFVVPESSSILKSVTTKSLIELAKSFGWSVEMRAVPWPEVAKFNEVAACGTAAVITVCHRL